jgi:cell division topological specificity factor
MNWLSRLFNREEKSSSVAKNRLQMVLTHDRSDISPGLIEEIKDDIIAVIAKRLSIDPDQVVVNLTRTQKESRLVAEIPIQPNGRRPKESPVIK